MSVTKTGWKTCTRCDEAKPLDEFARHPDSRDGRQSWCKECMAAYVRAERAKGRFDTTEQRNAYNRALRELRDAHRDEFDRLYRQELAELDV